MQAHHNRLRDCIIPILQQPKIKELDFIKENLAFNPIL